jgi:formylglycine-generating enzyme required for sulfatase activity
MQGVLRGASWMTRLRCRHPKARRFAPPARDMMFSGFRSCAL